MEYPKNSRKTKWGIYTKKFIEFCKIRKSVKKAIQTLKNLITGNLDSGNELAGGIKRARRVMRFTVHIRIKTTPFELQHGRISKTEFIIDFKHGKSLLSDLSQLSVLAPSRPMIPMKCRQQGGPRGFKLYDNGKYQSRGEATSLKG